MSGEVAAREGQGTVGPGAVKPTSAARAVTSASLLRGHAATRETTAMRHHRADSGLGRYVVRRVGVVGQDDAVSQLHGRTRRRLDAHLGHQAADGQ